MIKRAAALVILLGMVALYAASFQPRVESPPASRFIKINREGLPIDNWSGPWQCVFDQKTGLLWEVKTDDESVHDGYWSYSWFDGNTGVANGGDCYFETSRCDTMDLLRRTQAANTCGATDWRLPRARELMSLINRQTKPGEPTIATDFFPQTKRGDYWSGEHGQPLTGVFRHLGKGALAVNFQEGKVVTLPYRNAAFLRMVATDYRLPND